MGCNFVGKYFDFFRDGILFFSPDYQANSGPQYFTQTLQHQSCTWTENTAFGRSFKSRHVGTHKKRKIHRVQQRRIDTHWKYYQFRRIDKRNRKLNSWNKVSPKPDFVGKKEQAIDDKKVQNGSRKAEFKHSLAERIKKGTDCACINVHNEGIYLL